MNNVRKNTLNFKIFCRTFTIDQWDCGTLFFGSLMASKIQSKFECPLLDNVIELFWNGPLQSPFVWFPIRAIQYGTWFFAVLLACQCPEVLRPKKPCLVFWAILISQNISKPSWNSVLTQKSEICIGRVVHSTDKDAQILIMHSADGWSMGLPGIYLSMEYFT